MRWGGVMQRQRYGLFIANRCQTLSIRFGNIQAQWLWFSGRETDGDLVRPASDSNNVARQFPHGFSGLLPDLLPDSRGDEHNYSDNTQRSNQQSQLSSQHSPPSHSTTPPNTFDH